MAANSPGTGLLTGRVGKLLTSTHGKILVLSVLVVFTAGCTGFIGGDDGGQAAPLDTVPEGVDGVMHFESGVLTDQTTETLMDGVIEMGAEEAGDMDVDEPESWQEALDQFEAETDLSVDGFDSVTTFAKTQEMSEDQDYAGFIVQSDWTWEELVEASEDEMDDLEEDSYSGVTVYVDEEAVDEVTWIADLGDGTFALGPKKVVTDIIDTRQGNMDAFSGELRDAYESTTDGYMKGAFVMTDQQATMASQAAAEEAGFSAALVPEFKAMTMSYYTDGNEMNVDTQMTMDTEGEAEQFASLLEPIIGVPMENQSPSPGEDPLGWASSNLELSQEDTSVTLTFASTPEELLTFLETLNQGSMGEEFSLQPTADPGRAG